MRKNHLLQARHSLQNEKKHKQLSHKDYLLIERLTRVGLLFQNLSGSFPYLILSEWDKPAESRTELVFL